MSLEEPSKTDKNGRSENILFLVIIIIVLILMIIGLLVFIFLSPGPIDPSGDGLSMYQRWERAEYSVVIDG